MRRSGRSQDALKRGGGCAKVRHRCLSQLAEVAEATLDGLGGGPCVGMVIHKLANRIPGSV